MKPKTRYNIGLAHRKGVTVKSMGLDGIHIWYELYKETAARNHILLNDLKYFQAVLSARADDTHSPADVNLLVAEKDDKLLAAMFLVITQNRGSYLYGASSSTERNLMATYALQWEAICRSKEAGCTEYDMFVSQLHPTAAPVIWFVQCLNQVLEGIYITTSVVGISLDKVLHHYFVPLN